MENFGERLKILRAKKGITQEKLATDLNIPESSIRRLEIADGIPRMDRLKKIADYFGVSTDYLLGKDENMHPSEMLKIYLDVLELTDKEIYNRMTFKVDDMTLSKEEVLEFIAFVRYQRSKQKVPSASKAEEL